MRVIHHGKRYEIDQIICPECECEFVYNQDDLHVEEVTNDPDGTEETRITIVFCPECNHRFVLEDLQNEGDIDE